MGKALLTDEIIERANRGEDISGPPLMDDDETKILSTGRSSFSSQQSTDETLHIEVDPTVTKSRRIENQKRSLFQAKLNKILLWVVILLIGLIAAIIWWP